MCVRVAVLTLLCVPAVAAAEPRALPFTYPTDTRAAEEVTVEQLVDLVPLRAINGAGERARFLASALQTRIELALTDRLELGVFASWVPDPRDLGNVATFAGTGNGLGQWLRFRLNDAPDVIPVVGNGGVLLGVAQNEREIEIQFRMLFERRIGDRLRVAINPAFRMGFYYSKQRDFILEPSAGMTYEIGSKFHVGVEGWLRREQPGNPMPPEGLFQFATHVYVGPALALHMGKLWWSVGAYARVTDPDHVVDIGESYGRIWVRSMVGIELR
jgi:hypothetical protein